MKELIQTDRISDWLGSAAARGWVREHRVDLVLFAALAALASSVRLPKLTVVPAGLHGDEAWTGLDAARILSDGWIGPYVTSALGQPSGPLYFAAPFVGVFGETIFSVRLAMAVLGIATVPISYLAYRVMFGRTVAVIASLLLVVSIWHLHYSRLGFMVISWPLLEMLTLLFLFLGLKRGRLVYYGLAGLFFGLGVYTYNAYPIFVVAMVALTGWGGLGLARSPRRVELLRGYIPNVAMMAVVALIVAVPLLLYISHDSNEYFSHHEVISTFEQGDWKAADSWGKLNILQDNAFSFYGAVFWDGEPDASDGFGSVAAVDRFTLVLLIVGAGIALYRWRSSAHVAVLLMVVVLPIATMVTTQGTYRQTFGMVPFVALLAALPLALWLENTPRLSVEWRLASYGAIAIVLVAISFSNLSYYFGDFPESDMARIAFAPELTELAEFIDGLPEDQLLYFHSDRLSFRHQTIQFLAGHREGEDRSTEIGTFPQAPDATRDVAFVFTGPYVERVWEVAMLYPGGTIVDGGDFYRAYLLPSSVGQDPGSSNYAGP